MTITTKIPDDHFPRPGESPEEFHRRMNLPPGDMPVEPGFFSEGTFPLNRKDKADTEERKFGKSAAFAAMYGTKLEVDESIYTVQLADILRVSLASYHNILRSVDKQLADPDKLLNWINASQFLLEEVNCIQKAKWECLQLIHGISHVLPGKEEKDMIYLLRAAENYQAVIKLETSIFLRIRQVQQGIVQRQYDILDDLMEKARLDQELPWPQ